MNTKMREGVKAAVLALAIQSGATVHYVDISNPAPASPYTSWPTAATNIQAAVDLSANGDTVLVAEGLYELTKEIAVSNNVNILGAGDPEWTIIDGGHNGRAFNLGATFSVVGGFTIRDCSAVVFLEAGGGIYCDSRSPVVFNCLIEDNDSSDGGGMRGGTAYNCLFINNIAFEYGGGGMSAGIAYNCSFIENKAYYVGGGGLRLSDAVGCNVVSNSAEYYGGGARGGSATNCLFRGNEAPYGGGMAYGTAVGCEVRQNRANSGGLTAGLGGGLYETDAVNVLLDDNYAYWYGGGMYGGSAVNSIIIDNGADVGGGAFHSTLRNCLVVRNLTDWGGGMNGGTATNCTIYGNGAWFGGHNARNATAVNCIIQDNGFDDLGVSYNHCCSPDAEHGVNGNITNMPSFVGGGDYRLAFDSPCIDAGTNGAVFWSMDLDGNPRIINGVVDMGAYEYNPALRDSDSDGIMDDWELMYFSSATGCVAAGHGDIDPCSNLAEYIAGTDPTNPASYFHATRAYPGDSGFVVEWESVSNRLYQVEWARQLSNTFQTLEAGIAYPQGSYTDVLHAADTIGFYQLEVGVQ